MNLILMEFGYLPQYILLVKYYIQIVQQQHCSFTCLKGTVAKKGSSILRAKQKKNNLKLGSVLENSISVEHGLLKYCERDPVLKGSCLFLDAVF